MNNQNYTTKHEYELLIKERLILFDTGLSLEEAEKKLSEIYGKKTIEDFKEYEMTRRN